MYPSHKPVLLNTIMREVMTNSLYHFLNDELDHHRVPKECAVLRQDTKAGESATLLLYISRSVPKFIMVGKERYSILTHHIVIPENLMIDSQVCNYQYHARLQSIDNQITLQLQLSFDALDKPLGTFTLYQMDSSGRDRLPFYLERQAKKAMVELAMNLCMKELSPLHEVHSTAGHLLMNDVLDLLMEVNQPGSIVPVEFERLLLRTGDLLQRSRILTGHHVVRKILRLTEKCLTLWRDAFHEYENLTPADKADSFYKHMVNKFQQYLSTLPNKLVHIINAVNDVNQAVTQLTHQVDGNNPHVRDIAVESLLDCYNKAQKAFDLLMNPTTDPVLIMRFAPMVNENYWHAMKFCIKRLSSAMCDSKDQTAIRSLARFASWLNADDLFGALADNRPDLLEMMLSTGRFPVNRITRDTESSRAVSLLEYAWELDLSECFKILMAHGASVFISVYHPMPLVYQIISSESAAYCDAIIHRYSDNHIKCLINQVAWMCAEPDRAKLLDNNVLRKAGWRLSSSSSTRQLKMWNGIFVVRGPTKVGSDEVEAKGVSPGNTL